MNQRPIEQPKDDATPVKRDVLGDLRKNVTASLTDGSRNNPFVYFSENRSTRFNIAPLGSSLVTQLLAGEPLRPIDFEKASPPNPIAIAADPAPAGADPRPLSPPSVSAQTRFRKIQAKAREHEEERGLRTLYAALGMVSWPADDDGRPPCAPLFLVPLRIAEDKRTRGELIVKRLEESEIIINRALLTVAPPAFADLMREQFGDGSVDDVQVAYDAVRESIGPLPQMSITPRAALGIFNFALLAMIEDLYQSGDALAAHPVIAALAGDPAAQQALIAERDGTVDIATLDAIPPVNEPFVLDADPWQTQSIQTLLQFAGSHAIIEGPPGTGKSQTIGNLIAALIAAGQSVLFVCEKRAALDVVKRRLTAVGLGHLVLDMHGADVTRQRIYAQLRAATEKMHEATVASDASDRPLIETRESLNEHMSFMHTELPGSAMSPFQLLGQLAALPPLGLGMRLTPDQAARMLPKVVSGLESDAQEAAGYPGLFLRSTGTPWSSSTLHADDVPRAIENVAAIPNMLTKFRAAHRSIGVELRTRAEIASTVDTFRAARAALAVCEPGIFTEDAAVVKLAHATLASPFPSLLEFFFGTRKSALRVLRRHLVPGTARSVCIDALGVLLELQDPWRSGARALAALPAEIDVIAAQLPGALAAADKALGMPLADDLDAATAWATRCGNDRDGAYRAVRMREIEHHLEFNHLGSLVAQFGTLPPTSWASAIRFVWLQSHLEPLRPRLTRFDGRTHDNVVATFVDLEKVVRDVSRQRVCRAAGERFIAAANAHRDQETLVRIECSKARPRKPLRALFTEAPDVMTALAPCVMASPLSVSQFLPRATIFDVVVFDEGSQVTPQSAVTAILRGRRVVVAGDDRQLPPTDFFKGAVDEDDEQDETTAIAGTESILGALRPFGKPLGLRVHYRSRDERLIAFANHHLYDDALITFPGNGRDGQGLRFVHVSASRSEIDELSSGPEVARVVALILEHARERPQESLGVIALGLSHARRIDTALAAARHERPELDAFFGDAGAEPFFIKNLERVQGDERDAIILTIGYGRTKTGNISHNFGPINQAGGERRLNVAITRAKSRLTLVASFRKVDLNPSSIQSRGAKLLAAYLGYAESGGANLGRDGVDSRVLPNAFERDIQTALEARLQTGIQPQYGVGQFRIDLAVQHPSEPGRFVLAVECDGASYHSTPTARMRDRLRQRVLEDLGWHFCRIWSTDWFNNRERELDRVEAVYRVAIAAAAEARPAPPVTATAEATEASAILGTRPVVAPVRHGECPAQPPYPSIDSVPEQVLVALLLWMKSDGLLHTDEALIKEMTHRLGFHRRGARIQKRLEEAIRKSRGSER